MRGFIADTLEIKERKPVMERIFNGIEEVSFQTGETVVIEITLASFSDTNNITSEEIGGEIFEKLKEIAADKKEDSSNA